MIIKNVNKVNQAFKDLINDILANKPLLITCIVIILILIGVSILIYVKYISPHINVKHILNKEFKKKSLDNNDVIIILFYTDWCPYCKKAMPEWVKFTDYVKNINKSNDFVIKTNEIDCEKESDIAEKYKIEGYPTIKLIYKGEVYNYDAKPEYDSLVEFLNSSVKTS